MWFSGAAFSAGIERHRLEGQTVRVYGVAKTLADLFKWRNKVGLDVALEALGDAWRERRFTIDDLDRAARAASNASCGAMWRRSSHESRLVRSAQT